MVVKINFNLIVKGLPFNQRKFTPDIIFFDNENESKVINPVINVRFIYNKLFSSKMI